MIYVYLESKRLVSFDNNVLKLAQRHRNAKNIDLCSEYFETYWGFKLLTLC